MTDAELNEISKQKFGYGVGSWNIKRITTEPPKGFKLNNSENYTDGKSFKNAEGFVIRHLLSGVTIHIAPGACKKRDILIGTLGHELIHAFHIHQFGVLYIRMFSEHVAYTYSKEYFRDLQNLSTRHKDEYLTAVDMLKTTYSMALGIYKRPKGI